MNSGYLSIILIIVSLILLASGWKNWLVGNISRGAILLFIIGWCACSMFTVDVLGQLTNFSCVFLMVTAVAIFLTARGLIYRVHLFSLGLLLGSIYFLLREMIQFHPLPAFAMLHLDVSAVTALLAASSVRKPHEQIGIMAMGMVLGEGLYLYANHDAAPMVLGGFAFQDRWWLSVAVARIVSLGAEAAVRFGKQLLGLWAEREPEWEKDPNGEDKFE